MSNPLRFKQHPHCITLDVKVKPASRINGISVDAAGLLVVSLQAIAADGQANKMLIKYLAKLLKLQQKQIVIQRGTASRNKVLCITIESVEQLRIIDLSRSQFDAHKLNILKNYYTFASYNSSASYNHSNAEGRSVSPL